VELWQPCLFTLQKFKQPMLVEMHDLVDGDDDNDNPPLTKIRKFQLLSILLCKWKPLHVTIQYYICNILPFFFLYDF